MSLVTTVSFKDQEEMKMKEKEIFSNPAWHGDLSGIECEDTLRGLPLGSYLLRKGERPYQYYLSFVLGNPFTFKHQPFQVVSENSQTIWGYRNGAHHFVSQLDDLISTIMHCKPEDCYPVTSKQHGR